MIPSIKQWANEPNSSQEKKVRSWVNGSWVGCPLCKAENLSWDPRDLDKRPGIRECAHNPRAGKAETGELLGLACILDKLVS